MESAGHHRHDMPQNQGREGCNRKARWSQPVITGTTCHGEVNGRGSAEEGVESAGHHRHDMPRRHVWDAAASSNWEGAQSGGVQTASLRLRLANHRTARRRSRAGASGGSGVRSWSPSGSPCWYGIYSAASHFFGHFGAHRKRHVGR